MIKIDVHQHLWSAPLLQALSERSELPFVRRENGLVVLFLAGEQPYVIDVSAEDPGLRAALVERDGLDRALVCLSSPLGIESLPREQALALIDAYHDGVLAEGPPFGAWGAVALDRADAGDVDRALDRGCVGISLPAAALAGVGAISALADVLGRLEERDAPLLVHPGGTTRPGPAPGPSLREPLWWCAMTGYLAQLQAAWMAFVGGGRSQHPRLRVIFAALAGLAPLHAERLRSRGGPVGHADDPLLFYETSSYGPLALNAIAAVVGPHQLLYGSDRPVVEPAELGMPYGLEWDAIAEGTSRALAGRTIGVPA